MQIILLDKVVNLGNLGEIVKVIPKLPRQSSKQSAPNWKILQPPNWPNARPWVPNWVELPSS